jgi:hypothetical protein
MVTCIKIGDWADIEFTMSILLTSYDRRILPAVNNGMIGKVKSPYAENNTG